MSRPAEMPFSARLRQGTRDHHTRAENSTFVRELLSGQLGIEAYARYTGQLWHIYRALEEPAPALGVDAVAGPFVQPELFRTRALERDLRHLAGPRWEASCAPLPATEAYVERIRTVGNSWPAGYVAHHYTRYLGDLSGGQVIRATVERLWSLAPKGDGVRFYVFEEIGSPAAFKRKYRERLDAIPCDELEQRRIVEESKRAFDYNRAVFEELADQPAA